MGYGVLRNKVTSFRDRFVRMLRKKGIVVSYQWVMDRIDGRYGEGNGGYWWIGITGNWG